MKYEYKLIFKSDIYKNKDRGQNIGLTKPSRSEYISSVMDMLIEEGLKGWVYAETWQDFAAFMFMKTDKKWKYERFSLNNIQDGARSVTQQREFTMKKINELGEDGWVYVACFWNDIPDLTIDLIFRKENDDLGENEA